ncbi:MAG: peptidoglycan-binding protein [Mycobacteriales bacterium]
MAELTARRVAAIAAVAGALVGGAVAGGVAALSASGTNSPSSSGGSSGSVATAAVVRTTLSRTVQVGGSIGYDGSYTITARSGVGATYTWLPQVGDVVRQDQPVYSLNDQPVPLLYGAIPAYRAFSAGMSDGADVAELTRDLIALGYGGGLSQSNQYSSATSAAVQRWQAARGLPVTGEISLGEVVFEPGPIRVTSVTASVGAVVGGGTVLMATSTTPVVAVDLDVSQEYLVKPGDAVTVVLPNGSSTVGGHIETVGTVATCPGGSGVGTGGGGGSTDQWPCNSGGINNSPTVPVTITMDQTPPGSVGDQAPVNVNITTQQAEHVLAVPVNALLALAGGGFGVQVVTGTTSHLVGVTTGLYSNTLVQVSGSGITDGTRVEVPSS